MTLHIVQFACLSDNFGVLLHDSSSDRTVSIDAPETDAVEKALQAKGWKLTDIWVTHHHADHVQGIPGLRALYPDVKITVPKAESARIGASIGKFDVEVSEGDFVKFGTTEARILETPGHTAGHIVYIFDEESLLFAGDTLFAGGCGRVLETPLAVMWNSLSKLASLPGDMQVYCGHEYTLSNLRFGATIEPDNTLLKSRLVEVEALRAAGKPTLPTTISLELATNVFLRADEPGVQKAVNMTGGDPASVFAEIRERKNRA